MENNKKSDMWNDREIREMLSIIKEKHVMSLIDEKVKRNKNIFSEIASNMKAKNMNNKSDLQIRTKFKSLKSDFYKAKRANNKSGAKRQTSEQFDLLDDIFGLRPAVQAVSIDTTELDWDLDEVIESTLQVDSSLVEDSSIAVEEDILSEEPSTSKSQVFKRRKKNSYQKVVDTFSKEWKESQEVMLQKIREKDERLVDYQAKKLEEILERSQKAMKDMLEEDRKETAKMLQQFLNAFHPAEKYMFQPPQFFSGEQPLASRVALPKLSPLDEE